MRVCQAEFDEPSSDPPRRLPVYLLIDTSGSMHGAPIQAVQKGLQVLAESLRADQSAISKVALSVISFDSAARQLAPLTRISELRVPDLRANGTTMIGEALKLLERCISREVVANSTEGQKSDWKPLVFIMTDGQPTDSWEAAADSLERKGICNIIGCAAGDAADEQMLKRLTPTVVKLSDTSQQTIEGFFKWIAAQIRVAARSTE